MPMSIADEETAAEFHIEMDKLCVWPWSEATCSLGVTVDQIECKVPTHEKYLRNRYKQNDAFLEKVRHLRTKVCVGSTVAIEINRVDRSHTCPRYFAARVIGIDEHNNATLRCKSGIIANRVKANMLTEWRGRPITEDAMMEWPLKPVPFVTACRDHTTAFSNGGLFGTVCQCKGGCNSKRCACVKAGFNCQTWCHSSSKTGRHQCTNKTENVK